MAANSRCRRSGDGIYCGYKGAFIHPNIATEETRNRFVAQLANIVAAAARLPGGRFKDVNVIAFGPSGGVTEALFLLLLEKQGISPKSVNFIEPAYKENQDLLQDHQQTLHNFFWL